MAQWLHCDTLATLFITFRQSVCVFYLSTFHCSFLGNNNFSQVAPHVNRQTDRQTDRCRDVWVCTRGKASIVFTREMWGWCWACPNELPCQCCWEDCVSDVMLYNFWSVALASHLSKVTEHAVEWPDMDYGPVLRSGPYTSCTTCLCLGWELRSRR